MGKAWVNNSLTFDQMPNIGCLGLIGLNGMHMLTGASMCMFQAPANAWL